MTADSQGLSVNDIIVSHQELQAQLYRYAEDMHHLMSEHNALQHRFRALENSTRSVSEYRNLLSTLIHSASDAYLSTDFSGLVVSSTRSINLILDREDIIGTNLMAMVSAASRTELESMLKAGLDTEGESESIRRVDFLTSDDRVINVLIRIVVPVRQPDLKGVCHWLLRPLLDDFRPLVDQGGNGEHSGEAILVTDVAGRLVAIDSAFSMITGYAPEEAIGMPLETFKSSVQGEVFFRLLWKQLLEQGAWQGEITNRRKSGDAYPEWLSISSVHDKSGQLVGYFGKFHDLLRLHESEKHLSQLAYYDVLTGLPNRQLFLDRLKMAITQARRSGRPMGLCFIDLDRFKQVNDTLGHDVGDELLKAVAQRLKSVTREVDTVARLGGDEFTIILPSLLDDRDAVSVATKILDVFQPPVVIGSHHLYAAPSIGISLFPDHGEDEATLLRRADAAMYHAKSDGGNTYRIFELEDKGNTQALNIETAFLAALQREELSLVYQPQVSADGHKLQGVEALLRWNSPNFGEVSPEVFVPIAEWSGAIIEIGRWVIRNACQQLVVWREAGVAIARVAVNISARQLRDANFTTIVFDELAAAGLPGKALELEITVSELMLYPESTLLKLNELRSHGVSIAIGNFGTGYSNLAQLNSLPIDRVKVDRAFVHDLQEDGHGQAISTFIVTMANTMNLEVVAEGVETTGQLEHFLHLGCHSVQGFLFAKPMKPDSLCAWVEQMRLVDGGQNVA
jgi:diguanylate cyclase (GGDEF)-like protein/PAS domain S-box-containing protein